jgi:hypothetical protein
MQEETFIRWATEDWIGLSALGYSLVMEPGARAPGGYKVGPLALNATGYKSICYENISIGTQMLKPLFIS